MEDTPKSPKTPKLSEEVSGLVIEADNISNEAEESMIVEVEVESEHNEEHEEHDEIKVCDDESDQSNSESVIIELDPRAKEILSEIIQNSPAGQTQIVSSLCVDLFGADFKNFAEQEEQDKLIKDGAIDSQESVYEGEADEEFKEELKAKMDNYIKELFPETGKHSIKQTDKDSWKIHVIGERLKPKAFSSGHWHSSWSIQFKNEGEFSINGSVELTVHHHEEGSVQLSAKKEITSRVNMKYDSKSQAADKIYWKIKDSEDTVQVALNEAYQQLGENIFKKLRRQLPVTRTKMDWAKFANYNLSTELKK